MVTPALAVATKAKDASKVVVPARSRPCVANLCAQWAKLLPCNILLSSGILVFDRKL
jgi:hypothetical protein